MKWGWAAAIVFLVLSLAACVQEEAVLGESTAVPTPPPTVEPTATETAVPATATVVVETAVPPDRESITEEGFQDEDMALPTVTSKPTATTNPFNFVNPTPEPPLILELPNEDIEFQLKPPSLEGLLDALKQAGRVEFDFSQANGQLPLNSGAILPSVYADLARYFPDGFPQAQEMIVENPLAASYLGRTPILIPVLEEGFIQYLNSFSTDLENIPDIDEALEFSARPIELGGESSAIWLVTIDFQTYHVRDFALISQLEAGTFQYLASDLPYFSGRFVEDGDVFFLQSVDLTGDGQKEVLIENEAYLGGGGNSKNLYIYTWTGQKLSLLEHINMDYGGSSFFEPIYEIADFNGDSHEDIKVTQQGAAEFGCDWEQLDL